MYKLQFHKNRSKYFPDALTFATELGASYENGVVTLEIDKELLLIAYSTMRTLFVFVQDWKSTRASYNDKEVHPYQFILWMHQVGQCANNSEADKKNCYINRNTFAWSCKKVDLISFELKGSGNYIDNNRYWYNFGSFKKGKWVIDKLLIKTKLLDFVKKKALNVCPFFDEIKLVAAVDDLPDYILPDNQTFKIHYEETYLGGKLIRLPSNIRHITKFNLDSDVIDMSFENDFLKRIEQN